MKRQGACGAGLKWERQGIVRSRERERQRVEDAGGSGKGWELQMQTGPALGRRGSGRKAKSVQGKKQGLKRKKQEQERLRREDNTGPSDNF